MLYCPLPTSASGLTRNHRGAALRGGLRSGCGWRFERHLGRRLARVRRPIDRQESEADNLRQESQHEQAGVKVGTWLLGCSSLSGHGLFSPGTNVENEMV